MLKCCILCKLDATSSKSIEHIVPESLGNTEHVLPAGVVCDACNNYFARKVEKPFLGSEALMQLRFQEFIQNKRGRITLEYALLMPGFPVTESHHRNDPVELALDVPPEALERFLNSPTGTLRIPTSRASPEARVVSRFLAKMALEAIAHRLLDLDGALICVAHEVQLDPLRNFARRGTPKTWSYHVRHIHEANHHFIDENGDTYQSMHEFAFLVTDRDEWYFIFALFGLELAINVGGPEIEGYVEWLQVNNGASPLYHGNNPKPKAR